MHNQNCTCWSWNYVTKVVTQNIICTVWKTQLTKCETRIKQANIIHIIWKQFWMKNKRLWQVNPHQKHGTICGSNIYPKTGTGRQAPPTCKPWSDSVEMNWQSTSLPDNILLMQYEKNWWIATRLQNYIANLKICNPSFPTNLSWQVSTKAFSFWS